MNENPEGTPNPLNPTPVTPGAAPNPGAGAPATTPVQPIQSTAPAQPAQPVQPVARPVAMPKASLDPIAARRVTNPTARPVGQPVANATSANTNATAGATSATANMPADGTAEAAMAAVMANSANTPNEPIQKGSVIKGEKKMKPGIIVAIVCAVVAVLLGIAAVIVWAINPGEDRVSSAIEKVLSGNAPTVSKTDGTITIITDDETSLVSAVKIDLTGVANQSNNSSAYDAEITATLANDAEVVFSADTVKASNGDLYLKLVNVAELYRQIGMAGANLPAGGDRLPAIDPETGCPIDENGEANCVEATEVEAICDGEDCAVEGLLPTETDWVDQMNALIAGIFETVDGEWIRLPADQLEATLGSTESLVNNQSQCLVTALTELPDYNENVAALYKDNPFITYSTDDLKIAAKENHLYRLGVDAEKLAAFSNAMNSSAFANQMLACAGETATNGSISAETLTSIFSGTPTIYAEIDDDNNFTRLYFDATTADGLTSIRADLSISYPAGVTVNEPTEYIDVSELLSNLFGGFVSGDVVVEDYADVEVIEY